MHLDPELINRERRLFLTGFAVLVGIGIVFRAVGAFWPETSFDVFVQAASVGTFLAKVFFMYLVYRLSRALRQPLWLTVVYCILSPFAVLYLIPFIALLLAANHAIRHKTDVPTSRM